MPLYATFLVAGTSLVARGWKFGRHLIWCGWIAGGFDEIENFCSYLELQGHYGIAPLTYAAMALKLLFILAAFPACLPLMALFLR